MPGMLDTVLNVGCTSLAVQGLIRLTGRPRLAWDCRRRFLESYTETVLGLDPAPFAARLAELTASEDVSSDRELDSEALERLAADEQALIEDRDDDGWLENATAQLESAARAVYRSWMSERAQAYRRLQKLDHLAGHRGHGPGHGVRQWRTFVRRRRGVFAGSVDRASPSR